jgi:predicted dehydrogenase
MSNKIGIAVIGCGRIGITHLEAIKELSDRVELIAVVDINNEMLERIAGKYRPKRSYSSVEDVLKDPEVEAVVVALPHNLHCPVTLQAVESRKHVLVEKPMAISLKDADRMIEAALKADVNLMVGQSQRYIPALQLSKTYLPKIGRPFSLVYRIMLLFNNANAPSWWRSEICTGGLLWPMLGSHTLDYSLWLFDDRKPMSVYAKTYSNNSSFEGDDEGTIIIEMEGGSFFTNHLSFNTFQAVRDCIVNGPLGTMSFSFRYEKGLVGRIEADLLINGEAVFIDDGKEWNFVLQMKEFINSINENREPLTSGEFGRKVVNIIEAAMESSRTKKVVKI